MSRRSALWLAGLGSFVVYAVPILGVHGDGWLGLALLGAFYEGWGLWLVLAIGVALLLQLGAGVVLFWLLRRPSWLRLLGSVASVPVFLFAVQIAYLWLIPLLLLVEPDRAPDAGEAQVVCTVNHAWLAPVRSGTRLNLERAAEAWVAFTDDRRFGVLTMPGCQVSSLPGTRAGITHALVAPGGHIVFQPGTGTGDASGYLLMRPGLERPMDLLPPQDVGYWLPVLSDGGGSVGWLRRHETAEGGSEWRVHIRDLTTEEGRFVVLDQPRNVQLTLLSFRDDGSEYALYRYRNELVVFDGEGRAVGEPVRPEGTQGFSHDIRRTEGGWVAWDGYRDDRERARIVWSLEGGEGVHEVPRGRSISSVAVDPAGHFIAVSTTRSVGVGKIDDAVFVFRVSDGVETYRRRRPAHSRTQLAFLGSDDLALSPGFSDRGGIDVVRLGATAPSARRASDGREARDLLQPQENFVMDAVREVCVGDIGAEVLTGEHGDRGPRVVLRGEGSGPGGLRPIWPSPEG